MAGPASETQSLKSPVCLLGVVCGKYKIKVLRADLGMSVCVLRTLLHACQVRWCGGHRLTSGVFLSCCPPWCFETGSVPERELAALATLAASEHQESSVSALSVLRLQVCAVQRAQRVCARELALRSLHLCPEQDAQGPGSSAHIVFLSFLS